MGREMYRLHAGHSLWYSVSASHPAPTLALYTKHRFAASRNEDSLDAVASAARQQFLKRGEGAVRAEAIRSVNVAERYEGEDPSSARKDRAVSAGACS